MHIKTLFFLSFAVFVTANAQPADSAYVFWVEMVAKDHMSFTLTTPFQTTVINILIL